MIDRVFVFSSVKWNATWQRHQALAKAASESGAEVYFVEPHPRSFRQLWTALRTRARRGSKPRPLHSLPEGITRLPWSPLRRWTLTRLVRRESKSCAESIAALLYLPSNQNLSFLAKHPHVFPIYDKVIEWSQAPADWYAPRGWKGVETKVESLASQGAALLVTDSSAVQLEWDKRGLKSLLLLPAADPEFANASWSNKKTCGTIGYFGAVRASEIDVQLLKRLSAHFQVEVVGPLDASSRKSLSDSRVRLLPAQNLTELIETIRPWSALVFPYLTTARSPTLVPAKTWNALATGKRLFVSGIGLPVDRPHQITYFTSFEELVLQIEEGGQDQLLVSEDAPTWSDAWSSICERISTSDR